MTDQEKIQEFLTQSRDQGFCDDCIAAATGVDVAEVKIITTIMRLFPSEFTRKRAYCPGCFAEGKTVTLAA